MDGLTQAEAPASAPASPFCRELRSKKFYTLTSIPLEADDLLDASRHCWCNITQQPAGPDGNFVQPKKCTPGRSCYKSAFGV